MHAASLSILIVEDDVGARSGLCKLIGIGRPDVAIHCADDGRSGLASFRLHAPDLIITDLNMPVLDGLSMAAEIKALNPGVAIIALTAFSDAEMLLRAIDVGIDFYLIKPLVGEKLFAVIEQVSQRKEMQRRLQESEERLRELFAQSPMGIALIDSIGGRILEANPRFAEIAGRTMAETLEIDWMSITHPDDLGEELDNMALLNAGQTKGFTMNKRCLRPDGSIVWTNVTVARMTASPADNPRHLCTVEDITERKKTEETIKENIAQQKKAKDLLRLSEQRFKQLFDHSNDAIVIVDAGSYKIIDCNGEAEKIFGYLREELLDKEIFKLMVTPDRSVTDDMVKIDDNYWQIDRISILRKDGSPLLVSTRFKMITLNADQAYYCSFRDITDRVRIEEEALTAQANLIQADKMASLGLLVSGMAHEINNPNNCILFNSELLARTWSSTLPILEEFYRQNGDFKLGAFKFSETRDIIPKLFSGLVDGAERIRSIVDMLKDFARQDKGDTLAAFDVGKVIANAIAIVNHEIKKRCNRFYLQSGPDVPPALGNAQQIEQVMVNLIMNSLQSLADPNRAIRIDAALAADGERIAITVADEGEGMSAEILKRVTDPFFTTRGDSGGTGLGLSISTSILQKNQGSISFASAPGQGTTARVELRVFPGHNQ